MSAGIVETVVFKVVRRCANYICGPLSEAISSSLAKGVFTQELKQTVIHSKFRVGGSSLPGNWCPIANILPFLNYTFSNQTSQILFRHNLLSKEQQGFDKGRNTKDAIVDFVTNAIDALNEKCKAFGVFIDLQRHFTVFIAQFFLVDFIVLDCEGYHWNGLSIFFYLSITQRV